MHSWRHCGDGHPGRKTINKDGDKTGGEAGIRTLGRTLKALQRFSKPPPSASRPPHPFDSPASLRLAQGRPSTLRRFFARSKPQTLSVREISTCMIQLFLSRRRRFFKPPRPANSGEKFAILCNDSGHTRRKHPDPGHCRRGSRSGASTPNWRRSTTSVPRSFPKACGRESVHRIRRAPPLNGRAPESPNGR